MMNSSYGAFAGALFLACGTGAIAQTASAPATIPTPAPAVVPMVAGAVDPNVLRAGTPVALRMSEGLTTKGKHLRVGQRFQLEVAAPVELDGVVVIPSGSPATGEITEVRNKGMWGRSGRIGARVLFVRVNGRQIRLTGAMDDKGTTGTAAVVGSAVLLPIAGFVMTGTSAEIPLGAPVNAFVDEDVPLAFAAGAAPAPLVVPAAAPVPASVNLPTQ